MNDVVYRSPHGDLVVRALDGPGSGGAHHVYAISPDGNDSQTQLVVFQSGPVAEVGPNGLTNESLLAIVRDRFRDFQSGPFPCDENERALFHVDVALGWLEDRTKKRLGRGVEGRSVA